VTDLWRVAREQNMKSRIVLSILITLATVIFSATSATIAIQHYRRMEAIRTYNDILEARDDWRLPFVRPLAAVIWCAALMVGTLDLVLFLVDRRKYFWLFPAAGSACVLVSGLILLETSR